MKVSWYNDYLKELGLATDSTSYLEEAGDTHASGEKPFTLAQLPDYGRDGNALAFIIGNSKAMWPRFLSWLRDHPDVKDPVDAYTAETIDRAIANFIAGIPASNATANTFWANDMSPERLVDMNRAAKACALCYFSDEMFLSIHPTFGSWVAFRAVVVLDMSASHLMGPPSFLPPLLSEEETVMAKAAFNEALRASSEVEMSVDGMPLHLAHKWAAMRDCVSLGSEHKYSKLQSEYHYTKNAALLKQALEEEAGMYAQLASLFSPGAREKTDCSHVSFLRADLEYCQVLRTLTTALKPTKIVEYGVLHGASLQIFAENTDSTSEICGFDLFEKFQGPGGGSRHDVVVGKFANESRVRIEVRDFYDAPRELEDESVDILHIDIGNTGDVFEYAVTHLVQKLSSRGVMVLEGGSETRDSIAWMVTNRKRRINSFLQTMMQAEPDFEFDHSLLVTIVGTYPCLTVIRRS
mmetsp:Transcript_29125/g.46880  ORF Transcript_29125/g.46880 Transcript_29125/m.46880 type:complete len:466 (+) Transcript_29125:3-1400(+)